MTRPHAFLGPAPRPAVVAMVAYLLLAAVLGGRVPLIERGIFRFSLPERDTVLPLFRADGEAALKERYTDFVGLPPTLVDVEHRGYECSVEYKLRHLQHWLREHQAPPGAPPGPARIEIGLAILRIGEDGRIVRQERVDATGTATPVSP